MPSPSLDEFCDGKDGVAGLVAATVATLPTAFWLEGSCKVGDERLQRRQHGASFFYYWI